MRRHGIGDKSFDQPLTSSNFRGWFEKCIEEGDSVLVEKVVQRLPKDLLIDVRNFRGIVERTI